MIDVLYAANADNKCYTAIKMEDVMCIIVYMLPDKPVPGERYVWGEESFANANKIGEYNGKDIVLVCTEVTVDFFSQLEYYLAGSNVDLAIRKPEIAKLVFTVVSDAGNDKLSNVKDISANQGVIMPPIMYAGEENN